MKLRARDLAQRYGLKEADVAELQAHGLLRPSHDHDGLFFSKGDQVRLQIAIKGERLGFTLREIIILVAMMGVLSSATVLAHAESIGRICLTVGTACLPDAVQLVIYLADVEVYAGPWPSSAACLTAA